MRKYGLRILVGLVAFVIGIAIQIEEKHSEYCHFTPLENEKKELKQNISTDNFKRNNLNLDVEVNFKEFKKTKDGIIAVVKVKNNSTNPVYFEVVEDNKSPNPLFKFNDKIVEKGGLICGYSSINSKRLRANESREFRTFANYFEEYFDKSGNLRIGYSFGLERKKELKIYWSEEILIPAWVKDEIHKEKWRDLNSSLILHPSSLN